MHKIEDNNFNAVGHYDDMYIYDQSYNKIAEYGSGKIKENEFFGKILAYYKDDKLYKSEYVFDKVVATFADGEVYEGVSSLSKIGYYEGNRGYCAAFALALKTFEKEEAVENNSETMTNNTSSVVGIGQISLASILAVPFTIAVFLAITYAILKTAISSWIPNLSSFSVQMIIDYVASGQLDADDISYLVVVIANILVGIGAIIIDKSGRESLKEKITKNYKIIYLYSIIICEIVTFCLTKDVMNIIPIAIAGAVVSIVPAVVSGSLAYVKALLKTSK